MKKNRRFDAEFKKDIVKLYLDGGRSVPSLSAELGIHGNTIYKWIEAYRADPENAFPGTGHMKPEEEELARTKRRVRELEEEVEILKKAAAYFAKNST